MAGASAAQPVPAATVVAVAAGCDVLLYPEDFRGVIAALDRAVGSEIPTSRADEALARYEQVATRWDAGADQGLPDLAAHGAFAAGLADRADRKSTRLNSSHSQISYAVFCLKK